MSATETDLFEIIRQLRTELEWAARTGIVPVKPAVPAGPPPKSAAQRLAGDAPERRTPERGPGPEVRPDARPDARGPQAQRREPPPSRDVAPPSRDAAPPREPAAQPQQQRGPAPSQPPREAPPSMREAPPSMREAPPSMREAPPSMREPPPSMREPPPSFREPPPSRGGFGRPPARAEAAPQGPQRSDKEILAETKSRLQVLGERPELDAIKALIGHDCARCKLARQGRSQVVFGVGNPTAELMFIGEGPGADEDRLGEPFVGKAGQLLTKIIEAGMGIPRSEVYIANIVKCRPPNNRDPEPDEVEQCEPFLKAQIAAVRPKVIVALGRHAAQTLLNTQTPITRLRGRWSTYEGIPVMPTFHPSYLLRNPEEKRPVWEDVQEVLRKLGRPLPGRGGQS